MAYYIFLKSLRSLEEFRKNPHVKIPPKSPSINFQSLAKFNFGPATLPGPLGLWPSRPRWPLSSPAGRSPQAGPNHSARARHWRICKNTFSSWFHAFRPQRLLSLPSLTRGPRLLVSSSPPRHRDPGRKSFTPSLPRIARSAPRMPLSHYHSPHHSSP
jgi:hypothetical protein